MPTKILKSILIFIISSHICFAKTKVELIEEADSFFLAKNYLNASIKYKDAIFLNDSNSNIFILNIIIGLFILIEVLKAFEFLLFKKEKKKIIDTLDNFTLKIDNLIPNIRKIKISIKDNGLLILKIGSALSLLFSLYYLTETNNKVFKIEELNNTLLLKYHVAFILFVISSVILIISILTQVTKKYIYQIKSKIPPRKILSFTLAWVTGFYLIEFSNLIKSVISYILYNNFLCKFIIQNDGKIKINIGKPFYQLENINLIDIVSFLIFHLVFLVIVFLLCLLLFYITLLILKLILNFVKLFANLMFRITDSSEGSIKALFSLIQILLAIILVVLVYKNGFY